MLPQSKLQTHTLKFIVQHICYSNNTYIISLTNMNVDQYYILHLRYE
jgi:hypothetical protein